VERVLVNLNLQRYESVSEYLTGSRSWGCRHNATQRDRKGHPYLCYPCSKKATYNVLVPLELRLHYNEGKVGLGVHVAGHFLDLLDLRLYPIVDALKQAIFRPPEKPPGGGKQLAMSWEVFFFIIFLSFVLKLAERSREVGSGTWGRHTL
jgi:hypothetical protein